MNNMFNKVCIATDYERIKTETKKKREDDRLTSLFISSMLLPSMSQHHYQM
jgi:hypothetical protein